MSLPAYSHYPDYIITQPLPAVYLVLIDRPSRLNAFTERMWRHLGALFAQLSRDSSARAVVLAGSGEHLSVGLDMHEASQGDILNGTTPTTTAEGNGKGQGEGARDDGARKAVRIMRYIEEFQECVSAVEKCEKPTILLLHGLSHGLALDLAACADLRLATASALLAVKEVDIGIAADLGVLSRLPKLVGNAGWVKDVCLSARTFSAQEALRVGFVAEVCGSKEEGLERALGVARVWAGKGPVAVQGTKALLNQARDCGVRESLRFTAVWNAAALQSRDVGEAVGAWKEKRAPRFEKL